MLTPKTLRGQTCGMNLRKWRYSEEPLLRNEGGKLRGKKGVELSICCHYQPASIARASRTGSAPSLHSRPVFWNETALPWLVIESKPLLQHMLRAGARKESSGAGCGWVVTNSASPKALSWPLAPAPQWSRPFPISRFHPFRSAARVEQVER
jgi:hypothetical protein